MRKDYVICDKPLTLADRASFEQVMYCTKLIGSLKLKNEEELISQIIEKVDENVNEFMHMVFPDAGEIDFRKAYFDDIVEVIESFLSSSERLKRMLTELSSFFRRLTGNNLLPANSGRSSGFTDTIPSSSAPQAADGVKPND